jgi:hypothetical protein
VKTSDVLRKAGDVLRERGWCAGYMAGPKGGHCAYGAIAVANASTPYAQNPGDVELESVVGDVLGFNDAPGRTAAEVMYALDAAYVLALQLEGEDPADYEVL